MASNGSGVHSCPFPMKATSNGLFQGDDPLDFALPLAILQICIVALVTRGLAYLLRPLRQPRVIAEIIGGVLLGPSALGHNKSHLNAIFPPKRDASFIGDELLNTLKLALHCVDPSPSARQEVQQVLQQLEEIRPETAPSSIDEGAAEPSIPSTTSD